MLKKLFPSFANDLERSSGSFVNVRERLQMIMNDYECSRTFMKVHASEGSRRFTNLHLNVHEPSRRE